MESGGYEAMLHDLLHMDITNFNVRAVPVTDGLQQQKKLTLATPEAWWLDVLHRGYVFQSRLGLQAYFGEWHEIVATDVLFASYIDYAHRQRDRHPLSREDFGKKLISFGAKSTRPRDMVAGEHITDVENQYGGTTRKAELIRHPRPPAYFLGNLEEARAAFVEATGLDIDWQDSGDDTEGSTQKPKWRMKL